MPEPSHVQDPSIWILTDVCWGLGEGGRREEIKARVSDIQLKAPALLRAMQQGQRLIPSDSIQISGLLSSAFPDSL